MNIARRTTHRGGSNRIILQVVAAAVLLLGGWTPAHAIPASERTVLVNVYNATGGPAWTNNTGWSDPASGVNGAPGQECAWYGITCSAGQVIGVNLQNNHLVGTLPAIANLTVLQFALFDNNQLTGALPSLAGLASLQSFAAGHNQFTGGVPSLAGLTALRYFFVNDNGLTGSIPSIAGLPQLREFSVAHNQLTGALPALAGSPLLEEFYANVNRLSGPIPSLAGLTALRDFNVGDNQLTGPVPSLSGLASLQSFYIYLNQLSGPMALPPDPSALAAGQSNLCVNQLTSTGNPTADQAWDVASGMVPALGAPGWLACQGLDFGDQLVGTTSAQRSVSLTATADSGIITIASIAATGDFAQSNDCPPTLPIGATCTAYVTFTPTALGPREGSLAVSGSTVGAGPIAAELPLRGNGVAAPSPAATEIPTLGETALWALGGLLALLGATLAGRRPQPRRR